jgi:hypothetical protein
MQQQIMIGSEDYSADSVATFWNDTQRLVSAWFSKILSPEMRKNEQVAHDTILAWRNEFTQRKADGWKLSRLTVEIPTYNVRLQSRVSPLA